VFYDTHVINVVLCCQGVSLRSNMMYYRNSSHSRRCSFLTLFGHHNQYYVEAYGFAVCIMHDTVVGRCHIHELTVVGILR